MNTLTIKEKISYCMAIGSLICGFVLLFMGYNAPPEGEINSSVLYAFGEISLFAGSVLGISVHLSDLWLARGDKEIKRYEKDR